MTHDHRWTEDTSFTVDALREGLGDLTREWCYCGADRITGPPVEQRGWHPVPGRSLHMCPGCHKRTLDRGATINGQPAHVVCARRAERVTA